MRRLVGSASAILVSAFLLPSGAAVAQIALPGIVVDAPKPKRRPVALARPRPDARPVRTARRQGRPAAPAAAEAGDAVPPPAGSIASPRDGADRRFSSVTALTPTQTLARAGASLGDVLAEQPGVSATAFAPLASRPVIRGQGGFRVRTQENGIGTGDMAHLGEDHAVTIDPLTAGRVEVIRGPATLRYGSQAIGGVVSATNERIPTAVPSRFVEFETRGGFAGVSRGYDAAAILRAGAGNYALHADVARRSADDYAIPGGRQLNSSYEATSHSIGGSTLFDGGFVGFAYQRNLSVYFIPGIESAPARNNIQLDQEKWTGRGEYRIGEFGIDAVRYWLGYSDYKHLEIDGRGPTRDVGSVFRNRELEGRVEISHLPVETLLGTAKGVLGVQYGRRQLAVGGATEQLLAPATNQTVGIFLFEEVQVTDRLRLQAAGRVEHAAIDGTGARFPSSFLPPPDEPTLQRSSRTFMPMSASVGLLYDLPFAVTARATAQHVERSPDPIELYYKGPHDTPRTFEIGDPALRREKADAIEVGLARTEGPLRFDLSLYYARYANYIFRNFTGNRCEDTFASCGAVGSFDQITYGQRNASFVGGEGQAEYDVLPLGRGVVGVSAQADVVRASFDDGGAVPKIPPLRLGGGLYYRDGAISARLSLLHAVAVRRLAAFETPTPGYDLLNAEVTYTTRLAAIAGRPVSTVGIRAENLLDERIRLHQSYRKDEVLQPGRNLRLFATVRF